MIPDACHQPTTPTPEPNGETMPTGSSETAVTHGALMGTDPAVEIRQAIWSEIEAAGVQADFATIDAAVRAVVGRERAARGLRDEVVGKLQRENEQLRAELRRARDTAASYDRSLRRVTVALSPFVGEKGVDGPGHLAELAAQRLAALTGEAGQ